MDKLPKGVPVRTQSPVVTPRQMRMRFDNAELQGMNAEQRAKAITRLASCCQVERVSRLASL